MAATPVPPGTLTPPSSVYSFSDHSTSQPSTPQPGDRLDAQTTENIRSIQAVINCLTAILRADGYVANLSIGFPQLTADVVAAIQTQEPITLPPDIQDAVNQANAAANAAQASATSANNASTAATNSSTSANVSAANASTSATNAASTVSQAGTIAAGFPAAQTALTNATSSANDAVAEAQAAEQLAWKWGELLSGPVLTEAEYAAIDPNLKPPGYQYNPVGGVAGLWSAHWWAINAGQQSGDASGFADDAAQSAADAQATLDAFNDLYLGNKGSDPTLDNQGDALQAGALYFNTTSDQMRNWDGTQWQNLAGGAGITDAPMDNKSYARKNAAWIDLTTVAGIPDAPTDGQQYARQSASWKVVTHPTTIDWNNVLNTPATYPPSPHSHPESDVVGLVSDLALKAPLASPALTGNPTAPTQPVADNSTKLSTTAFVAGAISAYDGTVQTKYAPLSSPAFVNVPTAPTPAPLDNTTKLATTAFVTQAVGAASGTTISLSTAPPATPKARDWWWQSDTGRLFIYYDDGNTRQWVGAQPGATEAALISLAGLGPALLAGDLLLGAGADTLVRLPASPPAAGEPNRLLTLGPTGAVTWTDARAQLKTRYLNPGTFTHNRAPGATRCDLYLQGAGGAGLAGTGWAGGLISLSGGGGMGGFTIKRNYLHGPTMALIVGAGNTTTAGGTTSVDGTITALGGSLGVVNTCATTASGQAAGGVGAAIGAGGDELYIGQNGAMASYVASAIGIGSTATATTFREVLRIAAVMGISGTANVVPRNGHHGFIEVVEYFD